MARREPLRVTCEHCPGPPQCEDCLVNFFLEERDAQVLRFEQEAARAAGARAAGLDPDLAAALAAVRAAGLAPEVLTVFPNRARQAS